MHAILPVSKPRLTTEHCKGYTVHGILVPLVPTLAATDSILKAFAGAFYLSDLVLVVQEIAISQVSASYSKAIVDV